MARHILPRAAWERNITGTADSEVTTLTEQQRQQYLVAVASGASMHAAASALKVPYLVIGRLVTTDEGFAADLEIAKRLRLNALEETLIEQATVGIDEQLTHQGRPTFEYTEYVEEEDELTGLVERIPVEDSRRYHTIKKLVTSNPSLLAILKANDRKWVDRSEVTTIQADLDTPDRITGPTDREKIIKALEARAKARDVKPDDVEDLL
ncbi:MAG: hypothetical protein AB7Q00_15210 [Phycisphaerales bacterium]